MQAFLGLVLAAVGLGESRDSERKADGQSEKRKNGFHGAFPLRIWGLTRTFPAAFQFTAPTPIRETAA